MKGFRQADVRLEDEDRLVYDYSKKRSSPLWTVVLFLCFGAIPLRVLYGFDLWWLGLVPIGLSLLAGIGATVVFEREERRRERLGLDFLDEEVVVPVRSASVPECAASRELEPEPEQGAPADLTLDRQRP